MLKSLKKKIINQKGESKNGLEGYLYQIKSTLDDEKLKDKIEENDRETLTKNVENMMDWLDKHQSEEADVYDSKKKEVEDVVNPIMSKLHGQAGGIPNMPPGGGQMSEEQMKQYEEMM